MDRVQVDERLVTDIIPFVYKVTQIISPTEFVVINTYQNTEHKVEYFNTGWKFSGVNIPHQFNKIGYLPLSVEINERLVTDIMPFVYKVTQIISPTEFVVLNTYQNTEHKVEYSSNRWKFSGVDIPHQFNKIGYLISPPIIPRQSSPPRTIPLSTMTESMRLRPTIATPTLGLTSQPIISRPMVSTPALGLTSPPTVSHPTIQQPILRPIPQPSRIINPFAGPIELPSLTSEPRPINRTIPRQEGVSYDDWLEYVYNNHLTITWDEFQRLPDNTIIVPSIEQGPFLINDGIKPAELYFQDQLTTIGDIGRDNFYEYEGYAVLGSGTDNSILQSDLARTPWINTNL